MVKMFCFKLLRFRLDVLGLGVLTHSLRRRGKKPSKLNLTSSKNQILSLMIAISSRDMLVLSVKKIKTLLKSWIYFKSSSIQVLKVSKFQTYRSKGELKLVRHKKDRFKLQRISLMPVQSVPRHGKTKQKNIDISSKFMTSETEKSPSITQLRSVLSYRINYLSQLTTEKRVLTIDLCNLLLNQMFEISIILTLSIFSINKFHRIY